MSDIMLKAPELQSIEPSKAAQIKATFEPMVEMLNEFENHYIEIVKQAAVNIDAEMMQKAKRLRLDIAKVRIGTEKLRKMQKEEYLRAGKAIDGVANVLKWAVVDKEEKLKIIENHFIIQEKKRLAELQQGRVELISKYMEDAIERDLSSMEEDVWDAYLSSKKQAYQDRLAAEEKAEAERKAKEAAEIAEKIRIAKENARLKAEAEERERELKHEAEKRAKLEAELKAKEQEDARLKAEAEEREKQEKAVIEAAKQKELQKGDSDKMHDLIIDLQDLTVKYTFKSKEYKEKYEKFIEWINEIIKQG